MKPCACGCGRPVKGRLDKRRKESAKWATPQCIPFQVRAEWGRKGRQEAMYLHRRKLFQRVWEDLMRNGNRLTKAAIFEAFMQVHAPAYATGMRKADMKWRRKWRDCQKFEAA